MDELQVENEGLRHMLQLHTHQEPLEEVIQRLEKQQAEAVYKEETRKRVEWENEVERIRVEVAS